MQTGRVGAWGINQTDHPYKLEHRTGWLANKDTRIESGLIKILTRGDWLSIAIVVEKSCQYYRDPFQDRRSIVLIKTTRIGHI
jgi:hypothetical protein